MSKKVFYCSECGDSYERGKFAEHTKVCDHKLSERKKLVSDYAKKVSHPEKILKTDQFTSTGSKGAFGELLVSADLLRQGFHVFRSVSPHCPCDLVAMDSTGRVSRIEVKTSGPSKGEIDSSKADIVAVISNMIIKYYSSSSLLSGDFTEIMVSEL